LHGGQRMAKVQNGEEILPKARGNLREIISKYYFRGLLRLMNICQHVQCR